jgi:non-ribosomal peptide synthetase component F
MLLSARRIQVNDAQKVPDVAVAIVDHARRFPDRVALMLGEDRTTYGDLDAWSSAVAADLLAVGVRPGDAIAVVSERSAAAVVGQLAALRIGCWYVALDPADPAANRRSSMERCGCVAVLGGPAMAGTSGLGVPVIGLDRRSGASLPVVVDPALIAYVRLTFGTTGDPEGVLVPRGALGSFAATIATAWELRPGQSLLGMCRLTWDGSVIDLWAPLFAGGTMVSAPPGPGSNLGVLIELVLSADVDVVFLPTAIGEIMLGHPRLAGARRLRIFALGGDRLTVRPSPEASYAVWNMYGPTATAMVATSRVVGAKSQISIGTAFPGATVELLDDALTAVSDGRPGEIVVGGAGMALGYLGDPRRTAVAFVPGQNGRRYRTGDYARRDTDGTLLLEGRRDRHANAGPPDDHPADELEDAVITMWARVLGRAPAVSDDFFAVGGNSLLVVQLMQEMQAVFDVEISLLDFFAAPTPRALAQLLRIALECQLDTMTEVP